MFEQLRGQFAIALWDERRQQLMLGPRPLRHRAPVLDPPGRLAAFRLGDQGLLASGMVPARPDLRGIDHVFTFLGLPGPGDVLRRRAAPAPGHFLQITPRNGASRSQSMRARLLGDGLPR